MNDLAGWIANIIISVTDFFRLEKTGKSPYDPPLSPTFDAYYDYSATEADLFGNADSIGIFRAHQILRNSPLNEGILKLSDVFTLYYKGETALRPEISLPPSPSYSLYTSENRWKIFSLFFGFMVDGGVGGYIWVPDSPTLWAAVKSPYSSSNPIGKDYDNRLFYYSVFWLTRRESTAFLGLYLWSNKEYPDYLINHFSDNIDFPQPVSWIKNILNDLFETKFLSFVKNLAL